MNEIKKLPLWSALASYGIGALWICCFLVGFDDSPPEYWFPLLFAGVFFLWGECSLRGKSGSPEHWFWMGCTLLIGLSIALNRCRATESWSYLALHGFAAYWVLCRSGQLAEGKTGAFLPLDGIEALVLSPFGGFFLRLRRLIAAFSDGLNRLARREENGISLKSLLISTALVLAAVPVFLLAGNLLGQADKAFADFTASIRAWLVFSWQSPQWLMLLAVRLGLGLPVGAYLFGLVGSCLRRNTPRVDAKALRQHCESLRFASDTPLLIIFGGFSALYLLFFAVQAKFLLGAFLGHVPGRLTAAAYARDGFFQLCKVMVINFCLIFAAGLLSRVPLREKKGLTVFSSVLMVESIFLAVTAASKLLLYIQRFGFTPLRLLSAWAILVLTAGCALVLVSLRRSCNAFRIWVLFTAASFTALCFY